MAKAKVQETATAVSEAIASEDIVDVPKAAAPRRTLTNWMAFAKARLAPKRFRLWRYPNFFRFDGSSHTTLVPSSDNIVNNVDLADKRGEDLGVDFQFVQIRQMWPGWQKLADAGIEIKDLTCGVCQKKIPTHPQHLLQHMKRHKNAATGKAVPGGRFLIALGREGKQVLEEEAFWEDIPDEWID